MKSFILLMLAASFTVSIFGQGPRPVTGAADAPGTGFVKGMIHDSTSNGAIEYATVGLYREKDSSFVNGMITDPSGEFFIRGVPHGTYYLEVSFIGYTKRQLSGISIAPQHTAVDVGVVLLHPDITHIADVQIVAQSQRVEYKIDKKVVNVAQDISAAGGSLVNVLENTPSVQVDVEGNVSLRGSGNFQLLIDGKPSVIQGSEGLQQIPASAVQSLEIITSPSAKYDPDGEAGIINVIMKKQKNSGIGGVINASVGTRNKYTGDFLLNMRKDKINFYVGGEYADQMFHNKGETERRTYADTTTYLLTDVSGIFSRKSLNFKSGIDYYINDLTTLSLSGAVTDRNFSREFNTKSHWFTEPFTRDSFYREENGGTDNDRLYNLNIDYLQKYDREGQSLQASAYYAFGSNDEVEEYFQVPTNSMYEDIGQDPVRSRSRQENPESNLRLELDYTHPIGRNKLEVGLQSRWDKQEGNYIFEDYQSLGNEWLYNDTISNSLKYLDALQSVYSILSGPIRKFEYQVGLRAEYDNRSLEQLTSNESYTYKKFHFFPSFYVIRKLSEAHQLQFTYSRRIQRPDQGDLNPFKEYRGSVNVFYGNPELRPEFTNAFELNYQYNFEKGFISLETYYRTTYDKITRINGVDTLNGKEVYYSTTTNADSDNSLGIELMTNFTITPWWELNLTGNLFRYELTGEIEGGEVTSVSTSWRTNMNSIFKMKWDTRLQLTAVYNGPSNTLQGQREGFFVANIALRKEMLKKQLTVSLNARDVFATGFFAFTSEGSSFYTYNKFRREAPVVTLNLTYRLNNYRQAARRSNGQGEEGGGFDMGM
jgi:outer membrane receptor protein involved in Fe transport